MPIGWAQDEFKSLDLGNTRLNPRAVLLAERLASKPSESIPSVCNNWAETQAAYRLLANPKADWHSLLEPHWHASQQRIRAHPVVLNIQDTTELDFNGRRIESLGPLSRA